MKLENEQSSLFSLFGYYLQLLLLFFFYHFKQNHSSRFNTELVPMDANFIK